MSGAADLGDWDPDNLEPGPYFEAGWDGEDSCCGMGVEAGEIIRADGDGGWEHKDCVENGSQVKPQ